MLKAGEHMRGRRVYWWASRGVCRIVGGGCGVCVWIVMWVWGEGWCCGGVVVVIVLVE